jgi:hypothetical protein
MTNAETIRLQRWRLSMRISRMGTLARPKLRVFLTPLTLFLLNLPLVAQDRPGRIENARWGVSGDVVVITFDLVGNSDLTYDVSITLTRESDKNFKIVPASVTGSIGKGKHAGLRREIRWDFKKDVPQGFSGEDYAFMFSIQIIREEEGSNLLYYLAGGALVAGGAAVFLLSSSKSAEASATAGLPNPPTTRPPNQ